MRLVLDTSVVVAAFRSRNGASSAVLNAFHDEKFELVLSTALLLEYEDVLLRTEQMAVHGFSRDHVADVLNTLASRCIKVISYFEWRPQLADPADEMVLATAINGFADALITHNIRDFSPAAETLGVRVLTPGRIIDSRLLR